MTLASKEKALEAAATSCAAPYATLRAPAMDSARPHPPSDQRIAEARAAGRVPKAPLTGLTAAIGGLFGAAALLGPRIARSARDLFEAPLALSAAGERSAALARAAASARELFALLALAAVSIFISVALGIVLVQGLAFAPLARPRARALAPLRVDRTAGALFALGVAVWLERAGWADFARAWAERLAFLAVACLVIDASFARARFFASLWLTRREYLDEQREAFGAPEIRAARARARSAPAESP